MNLGIMEKTTMLRMAAVGCDYITSLGLFQLLKDSDFIEIKGAVGDTAEMLELLDAGPVDLVIVDGGMEASALAQTCRVLGEVANPPTVVVMGAVPLHLGESLVLSGVSAILHQGLIAEDLPVVLRMIHRGGATLLSDTAREALMGRSQGFDIHHRAKYESLNARERVVAHGVAEGMTNLQLATSMHMSEATVKLLVSNVMNKLGVANRVQIAVVVTKARMA